MGSKSRDIFILNNIRNKIVRPTLDDLGMWSPAAENLLLGTGLTETQFRYRYQWGGPAIGFYQCEPATFEFIKEYVARKPRIKQAFEKCFTQDPTVDELGWNLKAATATCRIHYWTLPEALPRHDDLEALGAYWKKYYNTIHGKGTIEKFVNHASIIGGLPK